MTPSLWSPWGLLGNTHFHFTHSHSLQPRLIRDQIGGKHSAQCAKIVGISRILKSTKSNKIESPQDWLVVLSGAKAGSVRPSQVLTWGPMVISDTLIHLSEGTGHSNYFLLQQLNHLHTNHQSPVRWLTSMLCLKFFSFMKKHFPSDK